MLRPLIWIFSIFLKWFYNRCLLQTYEGIKICDVSARNDVPSKLFLTRMVQALELVKRHDTRRFHRLQRHLHYIANRRMLAEASYDRHLGICDVDYSQLRYEEDEAWEVLMLAAALVHEATHGAVYSRNLAYDKKHRLRIERLCHQEEVRFVRRLSPEADLGVFDEAGYVAYFQTSRWRLAFNGIKHLWEPKEPSE